MSDHESAGGHEEHGSEEHGKILQCIFCSINQGKIPAKKIGENEEVMEFFEINPRAKGHTIIISRQHAATLSDLPSEKVGPMFELVQEIAKQLVDVFEADGYNVLLNNGEVSGQAIAHVHAHIIPRYKTDKHHAAIESVFPVDVESKNNLDEIFAEFQNNASSEQEELRHEGKKESGHKKEEMHNEINENASKVKSKWKFLGNDYKEDD